MNHYLYGIFGLILLTAGVGVLIFPVFRMQGASPGHEEELSILTLLISGAALLFRYFRNR
jgi:hypothetical protein